MPTGLLKGLSFKFFYTALNRLFNALSIWLFLGLFYALLSLPVLSQDNVSGSSHDTPNRFSEIQLPDMGATSSLSLSPQQEEKIGRSIIKQLNRSTQLINDLEVNEYVRQLGLQLVENTDYSFQKFHFFLLNSSQINAFATPGGIVAVYSGLFLTTDTESELASVLAHEVAHITQQHLARALEKAQGLNVPVTLGLIAAVLLGASTSTDVGIAAVAGLNAFTFQQQINFTRAHEIEADSVGMLTLVKSNFNPYGMPGFFQKLQEKSRYLNNNIPEFLRTHPVTLNRVSDSLDRALRYSKGTLYRPKYSSAYALMKVKLDILTRLDPQSTLQKYRYLHQKHALTRKPEYHYGFALSLTTKQHLQQAITILQQLSTAFPEQLVYKTALSQALLSSQHKNQISQALDILNKALIKQPYNKVLNARYAEALIQTKHFKQSIELVHSYFQYAPHDPLFYLLLSRAYSGIHKLTLSYLAHADYYYVSGEYDLALSQLVIAKKMAEHNFYQLSLIESKIKQIEEEKESEENIN